MTLIKRINKLLAAVGFATLSACSTNLPQVCGYNREVIETPDHREARLGHTIEDGCEELIPGHNSISQRRINVVFVGVNYTREEFLHRIQDTTDCRSDHGGLLSIEPIHSNLDNFNFWYNPSMAHIELPDDPSDNGVEAYQQGLSLASTCDLPDRAIFAVANWDFRSNAVYPEFTGIHFEQMDLTNLERLQEENRDVTSQDCRVAVREYCGQSDFRARAEQLCDAIDELRGVQDPSHDDAICSILVNYSVNFGIALIDSEAGENVVVHEGGHNLFAFDDEYLKKGRISPDWEEAHLRLIQESSHNCYAAETQEACEQNAPWSDMVAGCYQGCAYVNEANGVAVWRSIDQGMMNENSSNFGLWNELRICQVIDAVTHNAEGYCERFGYVPREAAPVEAGRPDVAGHNEFLIAAQDDRVE